MFSPKFDMIYIFRKPSIKSIAEFTASLDKIKKNFKYTF